MCDTDPTADGLVESSPRTASEIATRAACASTTTDGVLQRLVADRRVELGTVTRRQHALRERQAGNPVRPLTSYRLNADGMTYARAILRAQKAEDDAAVSTGE